MLRNLLLCGILFFSVSLAAAGETMEETKMRKRFGFGVSGGGPLSALGVEVDVSLTPDWSISGGLGTGLDYSTLMVKAKYYLLGDSVSPYFAAGFARWWTNGTKEKNISPSVLVNKFLTTRDYSDGFSVWLVYPALGVQFIHTMGFSLYAEVQYLFKLFNFANGTYAGMGAYWYF
jgi:hypothetical protein